MPINMISEFELGQICKIEKGQTGITKAIPGNYPLVTTSSERGTHENYQFSEPSVLIPLVSSSGHGRASIKRLHYQEGKFALGTILCAVTPNDPNVVSAKYLYLYLSLYKDQILVPLMKGAANVSLSIAKIEKIKVPIPEYKKQMALINKFEVIEKLESLVIRSQENLKILKDTVLQESFTK